MVDMTTEQYDLFRKELLAHGYKHYNVSHTIQRENWYFAKGFEYEGEGDYRHPRYQVLFLVYDYRLLNVKVSDNDKIGISSLIITGNDDFERIDLNLTSENPNREVVERYARKLYRTFVK